jgi:hypothetical protein
MENKTITITLTAEAAQIFETASEEQRRKLGALFSIKLSEIARQKRTLEEVMSDISDKAQERGLTPEILESLLHEE